MSYESEIEKYQVMTREREQELIGIMTSHPDGPECQAARQEFITSNLKLVIKIAGEYVQYGLDLETLIAAGNMGLVNAASRFDASKNAKFSVYASYWIRYEILKDLSHISHPVSVDTNTFGKMKKAHDAAKRLGEGASMEDISRESGVHCDRALLNGITDGISFDQPVAEGSTKTLKDMLDSGEEAIEQVVDHDLQMAVLTKVMKTLNQQELLIIRGRYGIGCEKQTLKELAKVIGVTHQRVQQMEKDIIRKMQESAREIM